VLGRGSLFAYIVNMTVRVAEIRRVLRPAGSFYLHCDPTASHYLKIIADSIFCGQGGDFKNEIIWKRSSAHSDTKQGARHYGRVTDSILFYTKGKGGVWNQCYIPYDEEYINRDYRRVDKDGRRYRIDNLQGPGGAEKGNPYYEVMGVKRHWRYSKEKMQKLIAEGRVIQTKPGAVPQYKRYLDEMPGLPVQNLWDDIPVINNRSKEKLGYPTQKPEALLERIIKASSNEGDTILDAYCGCGTTTAVAQRLNRRWIGIDITYQSISLVLRRLEHKYGPEVLGGIVLDGIPRDVESAVALAHKKDDRVRKEFEKWAVLTYTNNRAIINDKKGADGGIDGTAYFMTSKTDNAKIVFQVKSGHVARGDVAKLRGDMGRDGAELAILITLEEPSGPMLKEAAAAGSFRHDAMGKSYDRIKVVTVRDIIERDKRMDIPMSLEVLKAERAAVKGKQLGLEYNAA
jgi:DNA modification methylase